jgi:hypothetical protein
MIWCWIVQCNSFMFLHKKNIILLCSTMQQFFHFSTQEEYHFTMFYNATILSCFYTQEEYHFTMFYNATILSFFYTRRTSFYYVLQCNNSFIFLHKKNIILLCSTIQFFHVLWKEHHFIMFYNANSFHILQKEHRLLCSACFALSTINNIADLTSSIVVNKGFELCNGWCTCECWVTYPSFRFD